MRNKVISLINKIEIITDYELSALSSVLKDALAMFNQAATAEDKIKMFFFEGSALYMQKSGTIDITHMRDIDIALIGDQESEDEFFSFDRIKLVSLIETQAKKTGIKVKIAPNQKAISLLINNRAINMELDGYSNYDEWIDSSPPFNEGVRSRLDVMTMFDINAGEKITEQKIAYKWIKKYLETEHLMGDSNIHTRMLDKFINCKPSDYPKLMAEIEEHRVTELKNHIEGLYTSGIDIIEMIERRMTPHIVELD